MRILKKVAVAVCAAALFAQFAVADSPTPKSFKGESTKGLFATDVDGYMDVNAWQESEVENFFGFVGYNWGPALSTGAAHAFDKFYMGLFFGGRLDGFTATSSSTKNFTNPSANTKTSNLKSKNDGAFSTSALFGFGNIGIKPYISYNPAKIDNTDTKTSAGKTKNYDRQFSITPGVEVGLNTEVKGVPARFKFGTELFCDVNDQDTKADPTATLSKTKDSMYDWKLFGNVEFDGKDTGSEIFSYVWGVGFATDLKFFTKETPATKSKGKFGNTIEANPYFVATIRPVDRFTLKIKPALNFSVDTRLPHKSIHNKSTGVTTYETTQETTVNLELVPTLELGGVFVAKEDVVDLNFGVAVRVPTMKLNNTITKTCESTTGKVSNKTTKTEYIFKSSDGNLDLRSGFTVYLGKAVTFDFSWNILNTLVSKELYSQFNSTDFWGNVNKVVFGSQIGLLLSVKL